MLTEQAQQKYVKALIFEGKTVSEIKDALISKGIPVSTYTKLSNQGIIAQWRAEIGINLKKDLFEKDGVTLELTTGRIGSFGVEQKLPEHRTGFNALRFCSYLVLKQGGKGLYCHSLFIICDRPQKSFNAALKSLTQTPEVLFNTIVNKAIESNQNVLSEMGRVASVVSVE